MDDEDTKPRTDEEDQDDDDEEEMVHEVPDDSSAIPGRSQDGWENPQAPEPNRGAPPVP
mgnify:CR=1 FL=1